MQIRIAAHGMRKLAKQDTKVRAIGVREGGKPKNSAKQDCGRLLIDS